VGEDDCLDSVAEVELLQDVRDVRLHGRVADVDELAEFRIRAGAGEDAEELQLALGEVG
jgi:hypothetical protein